MKYSFALCPLPSLLMKRTNKQQIAKRRMAARFALNAKDIRSISER